jgi:uncharacterized membrane protein YhaH (DUF805 family)
MGGAFRLCFDGWVCISIKTASPRPFKGPCQIRTTLNKGAYKMSKPIFDEIFSYSDRRNRKSYALVILISIPLYIFVASFRFIVRKIKNTVELDPLVFEVFEVLTFCLWLVLALLIIISFAVNSQRFRDMGWSGWWTITLLIPGLNLIILLILLLKPGTPGSNKYGSDPLVQKHFLQKPGNQQPMTSTQEPNMEPHFSSVPPSDDKSDT